MENGYWKVTAKSCVECLGQIHRDLHTREVFAVDKIFSEDQARDYVLSQKTVLNIIDVELIEEEWT